MKFDLDILNLAVEFAKKIQKTQEYLNLSKAKKDNDSDLKLQNMIDEYNFLTNNIKDLIKNKAEKEVIDNENVKISKIYRKIMLNENMIKFNKASEEMNILMNRINLILIDAVNGKEPMVCADEKNIDCGKCGKCSGKI